MENNISEDNCDCPKECSYISYSFTLESTEFDPKEVCPDIFGSDFDKYENFVMKPFYEHKYPAQFIRSLRSIQSNVSDTDMAYCEKNLKYRAEVIFRLATDSMSVTVLSSRLSFFDKMSAFGKYKLMIITKCIYGI